MPREIKELDFDIINLSDAPRCSVQARYTLLGEQTNPDMGEVIPL